MPHPFALSAKGWDPTVLSRLGFYCGMIEAFCVLVILSRARERSGGSAGEGPAFDAPGAPSFRAFCERMGFHCPLRLGFYCGMIEAFCVLVILSARGSVAEGARSEYRPSRIDQEISSGGPPSDRALRERWAPLGLCPQPQIPNQVEGTQNARRMGHPRIW